LIEKRTLSFEEFFWKDTDLRNKTVLDAGTGFGVTTLEIAKRIQRQKANSMIISVDIDPKAFKHARSQLRSHGLLKSHSLLKLVAFIRADLSHMPIKEETVDLVISTRALSDVESSPFHAIRAVAEFYRVLKGAGKVVIGDECPVLIPSTAKEEVAVLRWQLAKAISHLIGRPHASEIFPEDLEFVARLVGFCECEWAVFEGENIPERRIDYFVTKSTEMCNELADPNLKQAFIMAIQEVKKLFKKKGGTFPPTYIMHATK
jgi:ubiquinone/menaquinone biosynthesis C-methylase UbiE